MDRQRTNADFTTLRDILTLIPGAETAKFYCEGGMDGDKGVAPGMGGIKPLGKCGKNLTTYNVGKLPNSKDYLVRCPRCGRGIVFSAAWLIAQAMLALAKKNAGGVPVSGYQFTDLQPLPLEEKPLPDGRKIIIAVPRAATSGAKALGFR